MIQSTTLRRSFTFTKSLPSYLVRYDTNTCSGKHPAPPCPECNPQPHPDCRGRKPEVLKANRVVCCPPPTGMRPPCPCPPTAPIKTCNNIGQLRKSSNQSSQRFSASSVLKECDTQNVCVTSDAGCGQSRDHVARRLAEAAEIRRRDYEEEAAQDKNKKETFSEKIMYRLTGEKECAPGTDGRNYSFKCPKEPRGMCGPNRTPPPPQCVELVPKDNCQIRDSNYMNPCAHRPPTLIHIDRSQQSKTDEKKPKDPSPVHKFTSRIMKSLNRDKTSQHEAKIKVTDSNRCKEESKSRCAINVPLAPKPHCRKPGIMETIKKHSPGKCSDDKNKRCFHTSSSLLSISGTTGHQILDKSQLNEAGLGRVLLGKDRKKHGHTTQSAGSIELHVPPGAERVRVDVNIRSTSHHGGQDVCPCLTKSGKKGKPKIPHDPNLGKRDSWLSIKGIQQKLNSRHETSKTAKKTEAATIKVPSVCPSVETLRNSKANPCAPTKKLKETPPTKCPTESKGDTKRSFSTLPLTSFPVP